MGITLKGETIRRTLADANQRARSRGDELVGDPSLADWVTAVRVLRDESVPKTYTAVLAILLTARAMHDADTLSVRDIKASTSDKGYSASSIGSAIASFAKEQRIDLRAKSSQPMNNQPFTFEERINEKMGARDAVAWGIFDVIVDRVEALKPSDAAAVLALLFHMSRKVDAPTIHVTVKGGKQALDKVAAAVAGFVNSNSDNGKVGQSFVAALFDTIYTPDAVVLGDTQDPDVTVPGDVQVTDEHEVWLWSEAKQKVIMTGDITGFLQAVHAVGGERAAYFALANSGYSGNIQPDTVKKTADRLGMDVRLVESPAAAMDWLLPLAVGSYGTVAENLIERMHARMSESGCAKTVLDAFTAVAGGIAEVKEAPKADGTTPALLDELDRMRSYDGYGYCRGCGGKELWEVLEQMDGFCTSQCKDENGDYYHTKTGLPHPKESR